MRKGLSLKFSGLLLVLGIPIIGLYLYQLALNVSDTTTLYIAIFLVMLFPIVIGINVLRSRPKIGKY